MRGRFITFEGGEGTGKSTHSILLSDRLEALGIDVVLTREPGGSPGAEVIRHVLLSGVAKPLGVEAEALLFAAARDDHVRTTIEPALARGAWVICDRFIDSTRVYQGTLGQSGPIVDPRSRTGNRWRAQARPYLHSRRAGGGRACASTQATRRGHRGPFRVGVARRSTRPYATPIRRSQPMSPPAAC